MFRNSFFAVDGMLRWLDRCVLSGLALLIVMTPLAIGSVHRSAFVAMEVGIFALVVVWMARLAASGIRPAWNSALAHEARRLSLPIFAMAALLVLQMTPLPPRILHLLSPTTYHVYQVTLPGWPYDGLHQALMSRWRNSPTASKAALPPPVGLAQPVRTKQSSAPAMAKPRPVLSGGFRWRTTLSLAPSVTAGSFIEFMALGATFFLVLLYPFGLAGEQEAQVRFFRRMLYLVVGTAAAIAFIGIAERAWWNGKILWFYLPVDWNGPLLVDSARASGPFVDPDHFANYLAMVLPLAVIGALFSFSVIPRHQRPNARLFFGATAVLLLIAIVLSLSRGGAFATAAGVTTALALCFTWARERAPAYMQRLGLRAVPLSIATFAVMMLFIIYLIGTPARSELGERLARNTGNDLAARITAWQETLPMIADFPLWGVGSGLWPEIFPHYQAPPESRYYFFRAAEDDYLQFVAENGLAGLALLLIFTVLVIRVMVVRAHPMSARRWPLFAGLIGGVCAGVVHEFVDFSFHIPANILLFTILLALALRVALSESSNTGAPGLKMAEAASRRSTLPLLPITAAFIMMMAACRQDGRAYPYNLGQPQELATAERNLQAHPAMSATHLALARLMPPSARELQSDQLLAASWLDPNEALARDLYARNLLLSGKKTEALQQISRSIYRAPFLELHYYLAPSAIPWLLPDEQQAISRGFFRAIANNFDHAADELASFFDQLGRYRDAGDAYMRAARANSDDAQRVDFLLKAGSNYARAGEYIQGRKALQQACQIAPQDPRPYSELAENIYGPQKMLGEAGAAIARGIEHGADPYTLEMAEADAAEKTGDRQVAEQALTRALQYDPSFEATLRLGRIYFEENRFDRAVATLQQAAEMNPDSAEAFNWLGHAQEADYEYYQAGRAYARAMTLAPHDTTTRRDYLDFQRRTAASAKQSVAGSTK